jgi:hypothetical protein
MTGKFPLNYGHCRRWLSLIGASCLMLTTANASVPSTGIIRPSDNSLTWQPNAVGTGATDEATATVEGVNGDTFTLTVGGLPSDWVGKTLRVSIHWGLLADDYDLYVHQGSNAGAIVDSSTGGAPETDEVCQISPSKTGVGVYTIHTIYFVNVPMADQPVGTVEVVRTQSPKYETGGFTFSPNMPDYAPANNTDGEPSNETDSQGNHYVCGIRGFPAGCDLFYYDLRPGSPTYDPNMRNPQYRGIIDGLSGRNDIEAGGDGGGDIALTVSPHAGASGVPTLAYASLIAANISTGNTTNTGQTFTRNPSGNSTGGVSADDRQWLAFASDTDVYMLYRTFEGAVSQIQRSTDGGVTYGVARTAGLLGQVGAITVDPNDGTVYCSGSTGRVAVGLKDPTAGEPLTYNTYQACTDPNGVAHLFFVIKAATDGTVYGCYSNDKDILLIYSKDHGRTWSPPMKVNSGVGSTTCVLPALTVNARNPDTVGVGWYGTSASANDDTANWNVFYAEVKHATSQCPSVRQAQVSDHFIHGGNISEQGFGGNANRNLLDYFQISYDPVGAVVVGFTDDHNDFYGNVYSSRQISGESANGGRVPKPVEGSQLPPRSAQLSPDGAQVVDAANDVSTGIVVAAPLSDPVDILSIRYGNTTVGTDKIISATMKVSTLANLLPATRWEMNFAANAPFQGINATKLYSNAVSDRGDQFFVRASLGNDGSTMTYQFGTTVRGPDGKLTETVVGTADGGSIDPTNNTITVQVSASKLNPFVTHGPAIGTGTVLAGLRGTASGPVSGVVHSDSAYGGTEYKIQ